MASSARFAGWRKKNTGGVYGFNVWMSNKLCEKVGRDGKVIKAGCTAADIGGECGLMKFMTKEAAVYSRGKGASWHPTRAFHLLRGEAIVWIHSLALLDAIYHLQKEIKTQVFARN